MTLDDALFNWLQIKYVAEQRPEDQAAQETYQFFSEILEEDHQLSDIQLKLEEGMYIIQYSLAGEKKEKRFPAEFVHQLYLDIQNEPKYNT